MDISILLTTYARPDDCIKCLNTLLPQKTDNVEILLLDDLHIRSLELIDFCDNNGIKYVFTGIQKGEKPKWRVPGYALNIGAKLSSGKYLILGNAEIYHMSTDTVEQMYKTNIVSYPRLYDQPPRKDINNYKNFRRLEGRYPFFMGVPKETFFNIGGYDEDFTGYAWEDTDLCYRLELVIDHTEVNADAIHLWNPRGTHNRAHAPNLTNRLYEYNKNLFYSRKGQPIRNIDREWGIF